MSDDMDRELERLLEGADESGLSPDQLRPSRTVTSTRVFHLPGGTEDNDLWVTEYEPGEGGPGRGAVYVPTDEQRRAIAEGANLELIVIGELQPPLVLRLTTVRLGKVPTVEEILDRLGEELVERVRLELRRIVEADRPLPRRVLLSSELDLDGILDHLFNVPVRFSPELRAGGFRLLWHDDDEEVGDARA